MALNAYLRMTGERSGEIRGSVTRAGREDSMMVIAYEHSLSRPVDPATGEPFRNLQHGELTITKEVDRATPLIAQALARGELITDWRLEFWQPSPTGQEVQFFTVELRSARVTAIRREMLNNRYPENMQHKEREHISFAYGFIQETWMDGGITWDHDRRWGPIR